MPVLKHAKKKLRQDKKRTIHNRKQKGAYKKLLKKALRTLAAADVIKAVSAIDKAAKNNLIHDNKAARLKSSLSKLAASKASKKETAATVVKNLRPAKSKTAKTAKAVKAAKKTS